MGNNPYVWHLKEDCKDWEKEKNGCTTKIEVPKRKG
jgi:hypothetical protein